MSDDHDRTGNLDDRAIYRLRWVTDAMEAARRYAREHPDQIPSVDPDRQGHRD